MTRTIERLGRYDFRALEAKWRPYWESIDLYRTGDDPARPNYYILDFFPYPSGDGLSVGHCRNYVPTCVAARFMRMRGYNVLHPMGWDAFGLPAENYAITHGIHPRESTRRFTDTYRRQMKLIECSYDWSREINSTDPTYYRWTQWFFLLLHRRGLAYQAVGRQWWCPTCQTILANEQVENGRCWRCDTPPTRKDLEQWFFRITDYADRLMDDLDAIDWPERIKSMQRYWIGRSEGAEVLFEIAGQDEAIAVFTTRPDTLYGATFLALAPEHPLAALVTTGEQATAVADYAAGAGRLSEIDRMAADRDKTGVFTGGYAVHPLTGEPVPIWIADYVLMGYGAGAIMGVPAHDDRDLAFARRYSLAVRPVIRPVDQEMPGEAWCYSDPGILINSGPYDGLHSAEASARIVADLAASGRGRSQVTYRLRDWLISRQRYWGAPIPMIHCPACGAVPVPESDLPVLLPEMSDFAPAGDGRSPLARVAAWVNVNCPTCGGPAQRETDTMDGFACSSWYFLRFANPHEPDRPFDPEAVAEWLPVDTYVGGAEQAVLHLLYARFWTKVMADEGLINFVEPFTQLRNQGMLLSAADGRKMSKSKGNVVTPDEVTARYGADALRAYILFLGPFDADVVWEDRGIIGVYRFLERYWKLAQRAATMSGDARPPDLAFERERHRAIRRITRDMERFRFNTAVAGLMEYLNYLTAAPQSTIPAAQWQEAVTTFTLLLAPIAPFVAEEVWHLLRHDDSVHRQGWPAYDEALTAEDRITLAIQVDGKLRDRMVVDPSEDEADIRRAAVSNPKVQAFINGRAIREIVVVPGRLVNVVTG